MLQNSNVFWAELLVRFRRVGESSREQVGPGDLTIVLQDGYSLVSKAIQRKPRTVCLSPVKQTTLLAGYQMGSRCRRWIPPLRSATIRCRGWPMQPEPLGGGETRSV
jgi:hypothetical protein